MYNNINLNIKMPSKIDISKLSREDFLDLQEQFAKIAKQQSKARKIQQNPKRVIPDDVDDDWDPYAMTPAAKAKSEKDKRDDAEKQQRIKIANQKELKQKRKTQLANEAMTQAQVKSADSYEFSRKHEEMNKLHRELEDGEPHFQTKVKPKTQKAIADVGKILQPARNSKTLHEKIRKSGKVYINELKIESVREQRAFTKDNISSIVNTKFNIVPIPFTINMADIIASGCMKLLDNAKKQAQTKHNGGFNIYLKLTLSDVVFDQRTKDVQFRSFIVQGNNITYNNIYNKIFSEASRMYNTPTYFLLLKYIEIVISLLAVVGGCNAKKCYQSSKVQKSKHEKIKLKSLPSSNNNCLFACINHFYDVKGNSLKVDTVRRELALAAGDKIEYREVP